MSFTGLNNKNNWQLVYQEYKQAVQVTPLGGYSPLPAFEVPVRLSSRILIVKTVSNIPKGKRWKWAGRLRAFQSFPTGINSQKSEVASHSLYLNRSKLLTYPELTSNFELVLSDAFWLRDLQLTIFEFTGEATTSAIDSLEEIKSKVDDIAAYGR
jgi:hypothetical protein